MGTGVWGGARSEKTSANPGPIRREFAPSDTRMLESASVPAGSSSRHHCPRKARSR